MPTKISWADESWSPVTGCTKVSAGCANCYAERMAKRFWKGQKAECDVLESRALLSATRPRRFSDVQCHPDRLDQPLHWRKPRRVFVCSMGDLFHEDVPCDFLDAVWSTFAEARQHQFLVLTKRPVRMLAFMKDRFAKGWKADWRNVWLGVSVEDQRNKNRIGLLRQTPAAVRFISFEPLLEDVGEIDFTGIHWCICGGESGPGARPMDIEWARSLRDQCQAASVPFFLKQMRVDGKLVKEPELDGQRHLEYPA